MAVKDVVTDFSQFTGLRADARDGSPDALRQAAEQFETLFLQDMLKTMRAATPGDPIFGDSNQASMYQQMFDQQLARNVAGSPGIGLADLLVRQLGGPGGGGDELGSLAVTPPKVRTQTEQPPNKELTSPMEFARRVWPYAKRVAARLGVVPQAVVAQAALETGWGKKVMQHADGASSNNFFGIKADTRWGGETVSKVTVEYDGAEPRRERANFRSYDSAAAGFQDYLRFLEDNPRYAQVFGHGADVRKFAESLQQAGYATDPAYATKIAEIADSALMRDAVHGLKSGGMSPID